ncbi:hypothetical protein PAPYR_8738 [Paratrimastix pyriformis]|uniref:Uncharacterized protein n=1 Tax=Paratrimastix pyriformis TaxID=342808 RepID=A0ABQ8UH42_9EUKA|nr:hypothetical protein PAPYR_8738 [Paratrimastix pyriformis]
MHPSPRSSSSSSIVFFGTAFVSMGEGRVLGAGRYGQSATNILWDAGKKIKLDLDGTAYGQSATRKLWDAGEK